MTERDRFDADETHVAGAPMRLRERPGPAAPARQVAERVARRLTGSIGDLGTATSGGRLAAALYVLCGLLVTTTAALLPIPAGANRGGLEALGVVAAGAGVAIWHLPWHRWAPHASLWLVALALPLIAVHNVLTASDGFRFGLFFLVVSAWVGLAHPPGTTLRIAPGLLAAYLAPFLVEHHVPVAAQSSLAYTVSVSVLVGETVAWVAERLRRSEGALRDSEGRFRSLVQHAADVITVVDENGLIAYDSPSVVNMLGYEPSARVGTPALQHIHEAYVERVRTVLRDQASGASSVDRLELPIRHADGSWRWCDVVIRNLLADPLVRGIVVNLSDVTERHRALEAERRVAAIVASSEDAIIATSLDGRITTWNAGAERVYGYPEQEMIGRNVEMLVPDHRRGEMAGILSRVATGERFEHFQTERRRRDGSVVDVSLSVSPVLGGGGRVIGSADIAHDITSDRQAADALRESEASFRLLFDSNPQPMWVYDVSTLEIVQVNEAAIQHYGYSRDEFLELKITDIRPVEDLPMLFANLANPRPELEKTGTWRHRRKDGEVLDVQIASHKLVYGGRNAVLVSIQDVTERNRYERALRHHAFHDELTGLGNRRLLGTQGGSLLEQAGSAHGTSLLLIDIDQFKAINQTLGPQAGDEVLREVARLLTEHVRPGDLVTRMGADEFAVLLAAPTSAETAEEVGRRLQVALAKPMSVNGIQISIEASLGLAHYPNHGQHVDVLLGSAETALGRAKASLARWAVYDDGVDATTGERLALLAELRRALDTRELVLHYQPKVDLRSGRIIGVEALVRWLHPTRGLLAPDTFIPLAERTGLIQPLTAFVLEEAVGQVASWRAEGFDLTVSVNLAAPSLTDLDLPFQISQLLFASHLPPSALELEITESTVMSDVLHTTQVVAELSRLGVGLSIDDFGTGHSSLAKLRALPITEIKLDKSFVGNMLEQRDDDIIVRSTVELGRNLGLRVVAEGVEDELTAARLSEYGCDVIQGFWSGIPLAVEELTALLRSGGGLAEPYTTRERSGEQEGGGGTQSIRA